MRFAVRKKGPNGIIDAVQLRDDLQNTLVNSAGADSTCFACYGCGSPVFLARGNVRIPHFKHFRGQTCLVEQVGFVKDTPSTQHAMDLATRTNPWAPGYPFYSLWSSFFSDAGHIPHTKNEKVASCRLPHWQFIADAVVTNPRVTRRLLALEDSAEDHPLFFQFQHAMISSAVVRSRNSAFTSDHGGSLVWIVNCSYLNGAYTLETVRFGEDNADASFKRLCFHDPEKSLMQTHNMYPMANVILESRSNPDVVVLLDFGRGDPLFKVTNSPVEAVEALEVSEIPRATFEDAVFEDGIGGCRMLEPGSEKDVVFSGKTAVFDYGRIYKVLLEANKDGNARDVYGTMRAFEALERLPLSAFFTVERWTAHYGFVVFAEILSRMTCCHTAAFQAYQKWIERALKQNVMFYRRMPVGKYTGFRVNELPRSYVRWASENMEPKEEDEGIKIKGKDVEFNKTLEAIQMRHAVDNDEVAAHFKTPMFKFSLGTVIWLMESVYTLKFRCKRNRPTNTDATETGDTYKRARIK